VNWARFFVNYLATRFRARIRVSESLPGSESVVTGRDSVTWRRAAHEIFPNPNGCLAGARRNWLVCLQTARNELGSNQRHYSTRRGRNPGRAVFWNKRLADARRDRPWAKGQTACFGWMRLTTGDPLDFFVLFFFDSRAGRECWTG